MKALQVIILLLNIPVQPLSILLTKKEILLPVRTQQQQEIAVFFPEIMESLSEVCRGKFSSYVGPFGHVKYRYRNPSNFILEKLLIKELSAWHMKNMIRDCSLINTYIHPDEIKSKSKLFQTKYISNVVSRHGHDFNKRVNWNFGYEEEIGQRVLNLAEDVVDLIDNIPIDYLEALIDLQDLRCYLYLLDGKVCEKLVIRALEEKTKYLARDIYLTAQFWSTSRVIDNYLNTNSLWVHFTIDFYEYQKPFKFLYGETIFYQKTNKSIPYLVRTKDQFQNVDGLWFSHFQTVDHTKIYIKGRAHQTFEPIRSTFISCNNRNQYDLHSLDIAFYPIQYENSTELIVRNLTSKNFESEEPIKLTPQKRTKITEYGEYLITIIVDGVEASEEPCLLKSSYGPLITGTARWEAIDIPRPKSISPTDIELPEEEATKPMFESILFYLGMSTKIFVISCCAILFIAYISRKKNLWWISDVWDLVQIFMTHLFLADWVDDRFRQLENFCQRSGFIRMMKNGALKSDETEDDVC